MADRLTIFGACVFAFIAMVIGIIAIWTEDERWANTAGIFLIIFLILMVSLFVRKMWSAR